ncbi:VQ motif-containing protein 4 [Nymphaea thermarum]|nr:VQ motif-containing protein 4 [Nymphaea thermarum]
MSTLFLREMDAVNPSSSPFHQPQPPFTSTSNNGATSPAPSPPCRPPRKPSLIFRDGSPSTTFVQVQPSSFKQVVQMLTSSREQPPVRASSGYPPPSSSLPVFKKASCCSPSKLLVRRRNNFRNLKLAALSSDFTDSSSLLTLSPSSLVDLTQLSLSPVTPLGSDSFTAVPAATAKETAIAGKGFYLHPTTPRGGEESVSPPRLLPLFPTTSPTVSPSSPS